MKSSSFIVSDSKDIIYTSSCKAVAKAVIGLLGFYFKGFVATI